MCENTFSMVKQVKCKIRNRMAGGHWTMVSDLIDKRTIVLEKPRSQASH